jgi:transmembrane sensor
LKELFFYILRGQASGRERSDFFRELESDQELKREYMAVEKLWLTHKMVGKRTSEKFRKHSFNDFWGSRKKRKGFSIWPTISGAAAILIISLLVGKFIFPGTWPFTPHLVEFSSPRGSISQINLEDGSRIWLNSGASAKVVTYGSYKTSVDLEGEAFFDVVHNDFRQFVVQTGDYSIYDKGTTFNVDYDKERNVITMALFEGAVEFQKGNRSLLKNLEPGKMFCFDIDEHRISVRRADQDFITAWKEGKFVFVDKTLAEIVEELEEWFDVKFIYKDPKVKEEVFTGVIKRRTNMEHLLKVLRLSSKMQYNIENQEDGSCVVTFE